MENTTNRKVRHVLSAVVVSGLILATTACGTGNEETSGVTGPAPVSESASASPSVSAAPAVTFPDGEPVTGTHGLTVKGSAKNENGEYLQITIAKDDPALVYQPELVQPEVAAAFTPDEIAEAQKFLMTFAVEEYMDSVLNDGYDQVDEWIAANRHRISPVLLTQLKPHADANKHFVHRKNIGSDYLGKVVTAHDKESTRIVGYGLRLTNVKQDPKDVSSIVFQADYGFDAVGQYIDSNEYTRIDVDGKLTLAAQKDPNNPGKWLITGIHGDYTGVPTSGPLASAPAQ